MPSRVRPEVCVACKGRRLLCGRAKCPILERIRAVRRLRLPGRVLEGGTPPEALVGEAGYPRVSLGPLVSEDPALPSPREMLSMGLDRIVALRSSMVMPTVRLSVRRAESSRDLEEVRLAAMSSSPVGVEAVLRRPPRPRLDFDGVLAPVGPRAPAERVRLTEEPRVPRPVERAVSDSDALASDLVVEMYEAGVDVYHSSRLLSLGALGRRGARRLVPTRWAITAVDSIVGRALKRRVLDLPEYSGPPLLYRWEFSDNRYLILVLPGPYRLEVVEAWLSGSPWARSGVGVFSNYEGPLDDGFPVMDGGHYAMRLPVLEHMVGVGRQASVLALREVGPGYYAPVGCWQIREALRRAGEVRLPGGGRGGRAPGPQVRRLSPPGRVQGPERGRGAAQDLRLPLTASATLLTLSGSTLPSLFR
ncbi:MAG: hypothetical protein DRO06_04375 [Thermoproteota archaeon]|nr:MAG: hypothetical protein DRO06_04375 [Candidatus Korarchaeota archaeon]